MIIPKQKVKETWYLAKEVENLQPHKNIHPYVYKLYS